MLRIFLILSFLLSILLFEAIAADLKKINIIIEVSKNDDKKLQKALKEHKKTLEEKTKLKLVSHRKTYLESEGKEYLHKLLHSLGYYEAEIEIGEVTKIENNTIIFNITPNAQYTIGSINIVVPEGSYVSKDYLNFPNKDWYKLKLSERASAKVILQEQVRLQEYIESNNNVLRVEVVHAAIVNHVTQTVDIDYNVITGPKARIKAVRFEGLKTIDESYVRKLVPIKNGEDFKIANVKESQTLLQQSGLLTLAEPMVPEDTDKDGSVELNYKVKERKHKSVKAGLNYSTDLGAGVILGWEHRNVFSQGEKISSTLSATKKEQVFDTLFQKPCFLNDKQTLKVSNTIAKKETLAYHDKSASLAAGLERELTKKIKAGAGIKYSFNRIEDNTNKIQNFGLLSIPLYGSYDSRDNILNPSKGIFVNAEVSPFYNTINRNEKFTKNVISGRGYIQADSTMEPTLAIKLETGMIAGVTTGNIPATERFYSGGAGSVRGYGYQLVGPLNQKNEPIGGRSYVESSAEFRFKISKKIGLAIFGDGGNVYDKTSMKFDKHLMWGAGFGVRYYTDFGPLRADIAFPVSKRRHKIDRAFQLYFSIGQAF